MMLRNIKEDWFNFSGNAVPVQESCATPSPSGTLLFVHGRFYDAHLWWHLIENLNDQFRCLVIDLPGFGRSVTLPDESLELQDLACLIQQVAQGYMGAGPVIIIGHDIGGMLAQLAVLQSPKSGTAIILMNSTSLIDSGDDLNPGFLSWRHHYWFRRLKRVSKSAVLERLGLHSDRNRFLKSIQRSWPGHYERLAWKSRIQTTAVPTLLLWGALDELNPPSLGSELLRMIPEGYFFEHPEAGHWVFLDQPEWTLNKIREFLFYIIRLRKVG